MNTITLEPLADSRPNTRDENRRGPIGEMAGLRAKGGVEWDGRGWAGGARLHNRIRIEIDGGGEIVIEEWGPNNLEVTVFGPHDWHLKPVAGNVFMIRWGR